MISNSDAMKAILNVLGDLCCHGGWTTGASSSFLGYSQHYCKPAAKWQDNTVVFLFNDGGSSSRLPASNLFVLGHEKGESVLRLQILSSSNPKNPSVLGKQFFANQWVEFDTTRKLRVGFGIATSAKDSWRCVRRGHAGCRWIYVGDAYVYYCNLHARFARISET